MATQRYIVEQKGSQGAHVKTVLRHLSFAKQRFDSSVAPARKVCVMLAALVLLLIGVVCDERLDGEQRRRAQRQLDDLTPSRITAAGLFSDYTAVVTQFVRIFDADYDIARVFRAKVKFLRRMRLLFADGNVLTEGGVTPAGGIGETMTHVAISQAKSLGEVYYSNRVLCLWPPGAERDATRAVAGMADVISAMAGRIEAEVHSDSLLCQFGAFDLGAWGNGVSLSKTGQRERASTVFQELLKRLSTLEKAHPQVREDQSEAASPLCDNFAALAIFYSGRT